MQFSSCNLVSMNLTWSAVAILLTAWMQVSSRRSRRRIRVFQHLYKPAPLLVTSDRDWDHSEAHEELQPYLGLVSIRNVRLLPAALFVRKVWRVTRLRETQCPRVH